jgi:thiamine-monophosphate kinase
MRGLGEKELIGIFLTELPASQYMQNRFFESDAEVLSGGSGQLLFTTDEFSDEDFFRTDNPFKLGYNLAVATISDILAVGGTPYAYAHTVKVSTRWDREYVTQMAKGIATVLKKCGIGLMGGDLGIATQWGYTGICLGYADHPLSRIGASPYDKIYITGMIGGGNIEAAFSFYEQGQLLRTGARFLKNYFSLRTEESKLIRDWATCCIDTSDGVLIALNTLSRLNGLGYTIQNLPYHYATTMLCRLLRIPKELFFMGECGEYELLFAISPEDEQDFLEEAQELNLKFSLIGEFVPDDDRLLVENDKVLNLAECDCSARDFPSKKDYLNKLLGFLGHGPLKI